MVDQPELFDPLVTLLPPREETNGENPELPPPDPELFDEDLLARNRELETEVRRLNERLRILDVPPGPGEACPLCGKRQARRPKLPDDFQLQLRDVERILFAGTGHARADDPLTSKIAAAKDRAGQFAILYVLVRTMGPRGMTREEVAEATGWDSSYFSSRLSDLAALGLFVKDGTRVGKTGFPQTVYVADVVFGGRGA